MNTRRFFAAVQKQLEKLLEQTAKRLGLHRRTYGGSLDLLPCSMTRAQLQQQQQPAPVTAAPVDLPASVHALPKDKYGFIAHTFQRPEDASDELNPAAPEDEGDRATCFAMLQESGLHHLEGGGDGFPSPPPRPGSKAGSVGAGRVVAFAAAPAPVVAVAAAVAPAAAAAPSGCSMSANARGKQPTTPAAPQVEALLPAAPRGDGAAGGSSGTGASPLSSAALRRGGASEDEDDLGMQAALAASLQARPSPWATLN